jgi:hypothetical protein
MAKLKANKRPAKNKPRTVVLTGTCSNCRTKKVEVVKVKGAQVCIEKCFGGISYPEEPIKEASSNGTDQVDSGSAISTKDHSISPS